MNRKLNNRKRKKRERLHCVIFVHVLLVVITKTRNAISIFAKNVSLSSMLIKPERDE